MAFISLNLLFLLCIFVYVRSEYCDHDCTITINKKLYPCSTIEEVKGCKAEYVLVKKGIETQINISSYYRPQSQGFSKYGLYFKLLEFEEISNICYGIDQSIISKHQKQELSILCKDRIGLSKDVISKYSSIRSKRYPIQTLKAKFNEKERILRITALTNDCSETCLIKFKKKKNKVFEAFFKLPILTNESIQLKIPPEIEELEWDLMQSSSILDSRTFNFSGFLKEEKQNFVDKQTCTHEFPDKWKIAMDLQTDRNSIHCNVLSKVPCSKETKAVLQLWKVSNSNISCNGNSGTKIDEVELKIIDNVENSATFRDASYGDNYCARIHFFDTRCCYGSCPIKYSPTKTIAAVYENSAVVQKVDDNNYEVLWIVIPTIAVLLMVFLIILFHWRKRIFPNLTSAYDGKTHEEVAEKMKEIQKTSKQIILLLRCNEDEKKNRDIDQFIKFLERCCFCEVLHANTVSAHKEIIETSVCDWLQDVKKKATRVIVVITDRASMFCNPAKYKEKEDDPNSCLFTDRTFSVGVQMLKHCQEIRCTFARFCYTEEISFSELTDEIIEIPQALVHLFHCIHNKESLICDETEITDYWMADESFKYLYQTKPKENLKKTELIGFPMYHNNVKQDLVIASPQNDTVSVDLEMNENNVNINNNRKKAGVKLTNLHNVQNTYCTKLCDGQYDSGFTEC